MASVSVATGRVLLLAIIVMSCRQSDCTCTNPTLSFSGQELCQILPITDMKSRTLLVFHLKASASVGIGLLESTGGARMVWLGRQNNTRSSISHYTACNSQNSTTVVNQDVPDYHCLNDTVFRPFWLSWSKLTVATGKGNKVAANQTIFQTYWNPKPIISVTVSGYRGYAFEAKFEAPFPKSFCDKATSPTASVTPKNTSSTAPLQNNSTGHVVPITLKAITGWMSSTSLPTSDTSMTATHADDAETSTIDVTSVFDEAGRTKDGTSSHSFEQQTTTTPVPMNHPWPKTFTGSSTDSTTTNIFDAIVETNTTSDASPSHSVTSPFSAAAQSTIKQMTSTTDIRTASQLPGPKVAASPSTKVVPAVSKCAVCECVGNGRMVSSLSKNVSRQLITDDIVPAANVSAAVRRKSSAYDNRTSSLILGSSGVVFIILPVFLVVISDVMKMQRYFKKLHRQKY